MANRKSVGEHRGLAAKQTTEGISLTLHVETSTHIGVDGGIQHRLRRYQTSD